MYFIPAGCWAALIAYLSLVDGNRLPHFRIPYIDKIEHLVCYALLALLLRFGSSRSQRLLLSSPRQWKTGLLVAAYGVLLELLQAGCTSTRQFDIFDIAANSAGAALGIGLWPFLSNHKKTNSAAPLS